MRREGASMLPPLAGDHDAAVGKEGNDLLPEAHFQLASQIPSDLLAAGFPAGRPISPLAAPAGVVPLTHPGVVRDDVHETWGGIPAGEEVPELVLPEAFSPCRNHKAAAIHGGKDESGVFVWAQLCSPS